MGCNGNCDLELRAFNDPYRPKQSDGDCCGKCNGRDKENRCGNTISVTTDNVLWNGCNLRYLKACPGKPIEEIIQDADRQIGDLYCKFAKVVEYMKGLEDKIKILEDKSDGKL